MTYFNPVLLTVDVLSEVLPPNMVHMSDAKKLLCHVSIKHSIPGIKVLFGAIRHKVGWLNVTNSCMHSLKKISQGGIHN